MPEIRTSVNRETASKISYVATMTGHSRRMLYGLLVDKVMEDLTQDQVTDIVCNLDDIFLVAQARPGFEKDYEE